MKKLLKAVAIAMVMCMLLSTAAFAETLVGDFGGVVKPEDLATSKVITANVVDAGPNEQVVLLIVKAGVQVAAAQEGDIMFIDQKKADASGDVTFENILIKDVEETVDVHVGSAATGGPQLIGKDISLKEVTGITLVAGSVITAGGTGVEGEEILGATQGMRGYAAALKVQVPEGLTISKMIWGFEIDGDASNKRFSRAIENPAGTAPVDGKVQFAAAFDLATVRENFGNVTGVSAIFLTTDAEGNEAEHFTNPADEDFKKKETTEIPAE